MFISKVNQQAFNLIGRHILQLESVSILLFLFVVVFFVFFCFTFQTKSQTTEKKEPTWSALKAFLQPVFLASIIQDHAWPIKINPQSFPVLIGNIYKTLWALNGIRHSAIKTGAVRIVFLWCSSALSLVHHSNVSAYLKFAPCIVSCPIDFPYIFQRNPSAKHIVQPTGQYRSESKYRFYRTVVPLQPIPRAAPTQDA